MGSHRYWTTLIALILFLAFTGAKGARYGTAGGLVDVTGDAVQTFCQGGVPHTDWAGNVRLEYESGESLLPIGIYYAEPCRSDQQFSWPRFTNTGHLFWSVFVAQGRNYDISIYLDG